jgi:DNA-binding CsgD family transcriptional regulator
MILPKFARDPNSVDDDQPSAQRRRAIGISKRREPPRFLICDASMQVLTATPGVEAIFSEASIEQLKPMCRQSQVSGTTVFHPYDDETVLRIVPLSNRLFGCVAIFVDTYSHRGSIIAAAETYGLTKRETTVLQMIISGKSNTEIAQELFISDGTVGDHVKSLMRKSRASKRIELIAKIYHLHTESRDEH